MESKEITPYKPSAYYFRKALRDSKTHAKVKSTAIAVVLELAQLQSWVRERDLFNLNARDFTQELDAAGKSVEKIRTIGLDAVSELESVKARVREAGLIPPKWRVLAQEAKDKGWGNVSQLPASS